MSSPSISEISETYNEKQARATDGGVLTEVEDINIYPLEKWWITIDLGQPFSDSFARIPLGEPRESAVKNLNRIRDKIDPFKPLDDTLVEIHIITEEDTAYVGEPTGFQLKGEESDTEGINLANFGINPYRDSLEIEQPIIIEGIKGNISRLPRSGEKYVREDCDKEYIESEIKKTVSLYNSIKQASAEDIELYIKSIDPIDESNIKLNIGGLTDETVLPIQVELPDYDNLQQSPVDDFINKVAGGEISELEESSVYIYEKDKSEEVIGTDERFESFGVTHSVLDLSSDSGGFLSRWL